MMQDEDLALYFAIRPMPDGHQVAQVIMLGLAEGLCNDVPIQTNGGESVNLLSKPQRKALSDPGDLLDLDRSVFETASLSPWNMKENPLAADRQVLNHVHPHTVDSSRMNTAQPEQTGGNESIWSTINSYRPCTLSTGYVTEVSEFQ